MAKFSIFAKTALGLSACALLAACGGDDIDTNSAASGTNISAGPEDVPQVNIERDEAGNAITCPDGLILASNTDYSAETFELSGNDYAAFHVENGKRDGVSTTATGLQYKIIQEGLKDGASPVGNEKVTVHYHGYFPDGKVFDSSYKRGQTIQFPANGVIPGWVEALQDMKVCEARTLYIPGALAYGERGIPGTILPNASLLFNVQLIGVNR